jgi:phage-related protein
MIMPQTEVVFYYDEKGCPFLKWLEDLPKRIEAKARVKLERLAELGHELRRPEADYLRDGIYELRWKDQSVNYRALYFFHGRGLVVVSHGLTKESEVPDQEIDLAIRRKKAFELNPNRHSYKEG